MYSKYLTILSKHLFTWMFLLASHICAQADGVEYVHFYAYDIKNGLSSNRILSICSDSSGFLWMATDFGLDRFDGRNFTHFQQNEYQNMSREDVFFLNVHDGVNIMGGGYNGQLFLLDTQRDSCIDLKSDDYLQGFFRNATSIVSSPAGDKYVLTDGGMFCFDRDSIQFNSNFKRFACNRDAFVRSAYVDQMDRMWVGSTSKIIVFDADGKNVYSRVAEKSVGNIMNISPINNNKIVVSSFSNEVWVFDVSQPQISDPMIVKAPFRNIYNTLHDKSGRTWFATDGYGLWYSDNMHDAKPVFVKVVSYDPIDMKKIYGLCEDKNGDIWIGTQNSGLLKYKRKNNTGIYFSNELGLHSTFCSAIIKDQNGKMIVGTDGNGIFRLDPTNHSAYHLPVLDMNVVALSKQPNSNNLWVATWGDGIFKLDLNTEKSTSIAYPPGFNATNNFFGITATSDGTCWACSAGDGLYFYDKNGWHKYDYKKFDNNISTWIVKVIEDNDHRLNVLTTNGLMRLSTDGFKYFYPNDAPNRNEKSKNLDMNDFAIDNSGNVMLATNDGVYYLGADSTHFVVLDFVPLFDLKSIICDKNGKFWVAGSAGIISIDLPGKTYDVLSGDYSNVAEYSFSLRANHLDEDGNLYFGTNGGFFRFNPDKISPEPDICSLQFGRLMVNGQKVKPNSGVLAGGNINQVGVLKLNHDQTEIDLEVLYVDNAEWNQAKCRYKIVGFNDSWTDLENKHLYLNHIPSGKYQLVVCAYRPNEDLSERVIKLDIIVLPPWWMTVWFRTLVASLITLALIYYFRRKLVRVEEQKNELKNKVAERTVQLSTALSEKDRLISVIAHDLKNPMFAIESGLDCLRNNDNMSQYERNQRICELHESASVLQHKMTQLLEWALDVQNSDSCHIAFANIFETVESAVHMLDNLIKEKGLTLTLETSISHYVMADARMIEIVVENLISNSVKFTNSGGKISVKCSEIDNMAVIAISDNGVGMSKQTLDELRLRGMHKSKIGTMSEKGTGLGIKLCQDYVERNNGHMTIDSEEGSGTVFCIYIPLTGTRLGEKNLEKTKNVDDSALSNEMDWHILVVDDDELISRNISDMLSSLAVVRVAHNGQEALQSVAQDMPDLILSDVEMPVMNGIEFNRVLTQNSETAFIPFLFVSARTAESDRLLGLAGGAVDYICKPFNRNELIMKVKNILHKKQMLQQSLLNDYAQGEVKPQVDKLDPYIKKLIDFFEENYSNSDLSVDDIANHMASSQSTLNRKVKALTQKSSIDILTEFRLNKAQIMIRSGNRNIGDVAYSVGYSDPAYFSRKYREKFGYSPSKEQ